MWKNLSILGVLAATGAIGCQSPPPAVPRAALPHAEIRSSEVVPASTVERPESKVALDRAEDLEARLALLEQEMEDAERTSETKKDKQGGQIAFRGGYSRLDSTRSGEVFVDTLGLGDDNRSRDGFHVGATIDLPLLMHADNTLLGEIGLMYHQFSRERVFLATDAITDGLGVTPGPIKTEKVAVNQLDIIAAPKYRFDSLEGGFRPWIIPVGMVFIVNSPPSDNTSYLDAGLHFGAGFDVPLCEDLSFGMDVRYTRGFNTVNTSNKNLSVGLYLGFDF